MLSNLESVKNVPYSVSHKPYIPSFCSCPCVSLRLAYYWALLNNIVPSLRALSVCKVAPSKRTCAGVTAWVPTHAPNLRVIRPGSTSPSSRAMHTDHPLGRDPPIGHLCPSGFPTVARTVAFPHLMYGSLVSWVSPYWNWGCGLKTTSLYLLLLFGVLRPKASTPLSCRLLRSYPYPWVSGGNTFLAYKTASNAFIMLILETPEAGQRPRSWTLKKLPLLLCSTSNGFLAPGSTMLTLVNARGPYGTA